MRVEYHPAIEHECNGQLKQDTLYHGNRRKFYRFKLTHPDQNIYHGFEIEENEISAELIKKLR